MHNKRRLTPFMLPTLATIRKPLEEGGLKKGMEEKAAEFVQQEV